MNFNNNNFNYNNFNNNSLMNKNMNNNYNRQRNNNSNSPNKNNILGNCFNFINTGNLNNNNLNNNNNNFNNNQNFKNEQKFNEYEKMGWFGNIYNDIVQNKTIDELFMKESINISPSPTSMREAAWNKINDSQNNSMLKSIKLIN